MLVTVLQALSRCVCVCVCACVRVCVSGPFRHPHCSPSESHVASSIYYTVGRTLRRGGCVCVCVCVRAIYAPTLFSLRVTRCFIYILYCGKDTQERRVCVCVCVCVCVIVH